jgi:alkylation response protein AidB-like acyl-CoA dehydrogenase
MTISSTPSRPETMMSAQTTPAMPTDDDPHMPDTRGINYYDADQHLAFLLRRMLSPADFARAEPHLSALGKLAGERLDALAVEANKHEPQLINFDKRGQRVDEIVFHPAYHELGRVFYEQFGIAAMSYRDGLLGWSGRVPHAVKFALAIIGSQAESGIFCPLSMTDTLSRVLLMYAPPDVQQRYLPRLTATQYEDLFTGAEFLTEKHGGSDVGGGTHTIARETPDGWRLTGDKWFCSNACADVILTLARPEGAPAGTKGLGLFVVPRILPDGTRNNYIINRLKDKLGTKSMASGEVTFNNTFAHLISGPGKGFIHMTEMLNLTRVWTGMGASAGMRRSLLEAQTHAAGRLAWNQPLDNFPLMRQMLLDLTLETESCTALLFFAVQTLQRVDDGDASAHPLLRILTPLVKYHTSKRAQWVAQEAMEVRGGNGYIEDWPNARLVRDADVNAIWEGSSNIVTLDVARAMAREGAGVALFGALNEKLAGLREPTVARAAALTRRALDRLAARFADIAGLDANIQQLPLRNLVDRLAQLTCITLLLEEAEAQIAQDGSYRQLFLAARFLRRAIYPHPDGPGFDTDRAAFDHFRAIMDWSPVPASAAETILALCEG